MNPAHPSRGLHEAEVPSMSDSGFKEHAMQIDTSRSAFMFSLGGVDVGPPQHVRRRELRVGI